MINQNMEDTMATQPVKQTGPDKDRSDSLPGFLRSAPPADWICPNPPAPPFEFFDIHRPHFYMIHGVPMALVSPEVSHG
jgi:hypothetical protein